MLASDINTSSSIPHKKDYSQRETECSCSNINLMLKIVAKQIGCNQFFCLQIEDLARITNNSNWPQLMLNRLDLKVQITLNFEVPICALTNCEQ